MCKQSENTFSVSRYWPTIQIFVVKWNIISEISQLLLNDIFAEFDGSSGIKNIITDKLSLGGLQLDDTSLKITAESTKKYVPIR